MSVTTHALTTAADAMRIVKWYRLRWTIEQVFRAMKSDCLDLETSQMTTPAKPVTVALIAAIRVMHLVIGRDGRTDQPLTGVIAEATEVPALQAINTISKKIRRN